MVQRNAMRSHDEGSDFRALLHADPEVTAVLSGEEIDDAFDVDVQLRHVDTIFERVFGSASRDGAASPGASAAAGAPASQRPGRRPRQRPGAASSAAGAPASSAPGTAR